MNRSWSLKADLIYFLVKIGLGAVCMALIAYWGYESWKLFLTIRERNRQVSQALKVLHARSPSTTKSLPPLKAALDARSADPMPAFVIRLASLARQCRVEILRLSPQPMAPEGALESFPVQMELSGSPADLRTFLDRLTAWPLVEAEKWSLRELTGQGHAVLTGQFLACRMCTQNG